MQYERTDTARSRAADLLRKVLLVSRNLPATSWLWWLQLHNAVLLVTSFVPCQSLSIKICAGFTMRRATRRRFMLCLFLGALLSVLVAWGAVIAMDWAHGINRFDNRLAVFLRCGTQFRVTIVNVNGQWRLFHRSERPLCSNFASPPFASETDARAWAADSEAYSRSMRMSDIEYQRIRFSDAPSVPPWWMPPLKAADEADMWTLHSAYGWPLRCFVSRGIGPRPTGWILNVGSFALPYRPIPLGIGMNAVFYGLLIGSCWWCVGRAVRFSRERRAVCVGCRYPRRGLGDSPCPECGQEAALLSLSAELPTPTSAR